ncbi:MAG: hypothetical protein F2947_08635 [Actinobacteria bacterium]|uniref:Unannotated protein n=1 Tax=freshwater metagenome TaxID=449393 RepID=A0A6J6XJL3_9ZZZZ|nr:hypothetical protein [Actinomycetota bacterium]MSW31570.1 hypothetical protein [Actinomycetota bacterium]MSX35199.1 hypothetical protein [Actinomycetota bacterium]MSX95335.1 hypothetical protein [Actinomycetota bacterium]MSY25944.1 hypothetical protein [Actinomycetota bacterium]
MNLFADALTASSAPWPLIAVAIAAASGLCLWALFRRGSIADRARSDATQSPDGQSPGGD